MSSRYGQIFVFTGPTLHPRKAEGLLDATYLPPIKRGDLRRFLQVPPTAVVIIDGEFYQNLAVTPKEVLALLESGVPVYGASSIGAIRAVELYPYGMIGVGSIFRLFRRGVLDADDEVALAYSTDTFHPVSEPLVNTRFALRAAVRHRILARREADEIVLRVQSCYFPERTTGLTLSIAREVVRSDAAARLHTFLQGLTTNVKERDARAVLCRVRRDYGACLLAAADARR